MHDFFLHPSQLLVFLFVPPFNHVPGVINHQHGLILVDSGKALDTWLHNVEHFFARGLLSEGQSISKIGSDTWQDSAAASISLTLVASQWGWC